MFRRETRAQQVSGVEALPQVGSYYYFHPSDVLPFLRSLCTTVSVAEYYSTGSLCPSLALARIGARWPGEEDASCTLHRSGPCCLCELGRPRCPSRPARLFLSPVLLWVRPVYLDRGCRVQGRVQGAERRTARTVRTGRKSVRCEEMSWENGCTSPRQCGTIHLPAVGDLFTLMISQGCQCCRWEIGERFRKKDKFRGEQASLYVGYFKKVSRPRPRPDQLRSPISAVNFLRPR